MSFRVLLYLIVFIFFVLLTVVNTLTLQQAINKNEETLLTSQQGKAVNISRQLKDLTVELDQMAVNLSRPKEISHAVEAADNDVLYDWSNAFTEGIDSIIFIDPEGIVLARAPDEFRFGDSIYNSEFFYVALKKGSFLGLATVDGRLSLVAARSILKYNDIPVGVVAVVLQINPAMLQQLVPDESTVLLASGPQGHIASLPISGPVQWSVPLFTDKIPFSGADIFSVKSLEDASHRELIALKGRLYRNSLLFGLAILFFLLLFLRWQFRPYYLLVDSIISYSEGRIDLSHLHKLLAQQGKQKTREITRIAKALINMVDTTLDTLERVNTLNKDLKQLATHDPLTGILNRRGMAELLSHEIFRVNRYNKSLSVVIGDIDYFKQINDTFGHQSGDKVLENTSNILMKNNRAADILCRWGGEEFLILCPEITLAEAATFAEKLRKQMEAENTIENKAVTISFGVTEYHPGEAIDPFLARADKALYQAKEAGRNRIVCIK